MDGNSFLCPLLFHSSIVEHTLVFPFRVIPLAKAALRLTEAMLNAEGGRFSFIALEKQLVRRDLYRQVKRIHCIENKASPTAS